MHIKHQWSRNFAMLQYILCQPTNTTASWIQRLDRTTSRYSLVPRPHPLRKLRERVWHHIHVCRFSWACRATPPMWKHVINIHRSLELTTVLCTVNRKLRERERMLQSNFLETIGRQTKMSSSQSSGELLLRGYYSLLTIAMPRKCLFECLPSSR